MLRGGQGRGLEEMWSSKSNIGDVIEDNVDLVTTHGRLRLQEIIGTNWALLVSLHGDAVSVTELTCLENVAKHELNKRSVKVAAVSSLDLLASWRMGNDAFEDGLSFPLIADSQRKLVLGGGRCVWVLDPSLRIHFYACYPQCVGRHWSEIVRVVDALQVATYLKVDTPSQWTPGDDVLVSAVVKDENIEALFAGQKPRRVAARPDMRWIRDPMSPLTKKEESGSNKNKKKRK